MKTINIIGCGSVGRTLARSWTEHQVLEVRSVVNRSLGSAERAVTFVGAGRACGGYEQMQSADLVMISVPDDAIEECCRQLCASQMVEDGVIVFHCSGSLSTSVLQPAADRGALIASVHPIKSFAHPTGAMETFAGTFCAIEGEPSAYDILEELLQRSGARTFRIDPQRKTVYHAATVMVCNYLTALLEVGLRCFQHAGIPRHTAMEMMEPIVTETVANVFSTGTVEALTGPIARGDKDAVQRECEVLGQWDANCQQIYKHLGLVAVDLSAAQGNASSEALGAIRSILFDKNCPTDERTETPESGAAFDDTA